MKKKTEKKYEPEIKKKITKNIQQFRKPQQRGRKKTTTTSKIEQLAFTLAGRRKGERKVEDENNHYVGSRRLEGQD